MTYASLGGYGIRPAYSAAIGHDCPTCGAPMGLYCINPITGREKRAPCIARITSQEFHEAVATAGAA